MDESVAKASYYDHSFPLNLREVRYGVDSILFDGVSTKASAPSKIPHFKNSLNFSFSALSFEGAENTQYSYHLHGYDPGWSPWSYRTEKEYTNLPAGKYTFQVRARNIFGKVEEIEGYAFTILSPWYLNWWAYLLYLLVMGLLIWGVVRLLTRQHARRLAMEQQINERLRLADRMKDQFLANTSHELRTPLNGIIGLSESMMDGIGKFSEEKHREELSLIVASGKRLAGLVNDLLDFSKLKEGDLQLRTKPVDLRALVDVALRISLPMAKEKRLTLQNAIPAELPAVLVDEDRMQQVLLNLIGNAIKFTVQGFVKVGIQPITNSEGEDFLTIYVEDTGIGIPKDKQEVIFQAFMQADGSIERDFGGTGLGLAITKQLIELHRGQLWVESEEGNGATFYFTLPITEEKAYPLQATSYEPRPLLSARSMAAVEDRSEPSSNLTYQARVLIVDDEPINHHVLRNHLAPHHFEVTSAMDGAEALRLLDENGTYNLVLLDVMMPRMNGYEVCKHIREKYLPSVLPVIMITAKNQVPDLVEGLAVGANDYLAKPFSRDELLARVKTQLDLHQIFEITSRFVPNEFLHSLGRDRLTEVLLGDFIQREVTILFADIRNYTTLAESMTPEDNFRFVNAYHGRLGPAIRDNNGFVNQYLGDAIMAVFPESPLDALKASITMQQTLRKYNKQRQKKGQALIRVGMGLHTGPLIMGIIGDEKRMDAATIADTVNTASRIESLTKYYGANILLSEDSYQKIMAQNNIGVKDHFQWRNLGKVLVKGKLEPLGLYECFTGDAAEMISKKLDTLSDFDMAMDLYYAKDFEAAIIYFKQILAKNPEDAVIRFFIKKSEGFLDNGVPNNWNGVEVMEKK